jgi:energy-coupling factor transporter ATP-binding protein EcfA2
MATSKIEEIHIQNFKFFPELQEPIKLSGNHLLLYGENGSGKSSLYWALYTLLECANKTDDNQIKKYFNPDINEEERLINVNCPAGLDSYIKVKLIDGTVFNVSYTDTSINTNREAQESNYSSDFITYRNLLSLFNFAHSDEINLIDFFSYAIFPHVKFSPVSIGGKDVVSANEIFQYVNKGLSKIEDISYRGKLRYPKKDEPEYKEYHTVKNLFQKELQSLLLTITTEGNKILRDEFKYDFSFLLSLEQEDNDKNPKFAILLKVPEYQGKQDVVYRPHSFLNEARLTALGLAIRLAVLEKSISPNSKLNLLVLDDLLISLDMSNRDKVIDLIFKNYQKDYQLIFLTHDRVLYHFIGSKIKQYSSNTNWIFKEMYAGEGNKPIIISDELDNIDKASRYFKSYDFVAASLYMRKEIEKLVLERLPEEYRRTSSEKPHALEHLWQIMLERYSHIGHQVSEEIKNFFSQTKLMILNPQAHHSLAFPIYKTEIEKTFDFINKINSDLPIIESVILILNGSELTFTHSAENYSIKFKTLSDFRIDKTNTLESLVLPKCEILTWQYNGNEFWDFKTNKIKIPAKPMKHLMSKIKNTLVNPQINPLHITDDMFINHTIIKNSIWSLKEILDKTNQTI